MKKNQIPIHPNLKRLLLVIQDALEYRTECSSQLDFFRVYADLIFQDYKKGGEAYQFDFSNWHPNYISQTANQIRKGNPKESDFLIAVVRSHGYQKINVAQLKNEIIDHDFESAVDYLLQGQLSQLKAILIEKPNLTKAKSNFGHQASLIHYVASNGVETYRQFSPCNIADGLSLLLTMGCDPNASNQIYGGSDLAGLIQTSAHPYAVGATDNLIDILQ